MSVEPLTPEDSDFLAYYGKTMASIQKFEFATIRLARLILRQLSEDIPFESAWNRMEKQFKKADGPLAKLLVQAGHVPREILKELQHLLVGRKNLAHEFLLSYMEVSPRRSCGGLRCERMNLVRRLRKETQHDVTRRRFLAHELSSGCGVRPSCCMGPKESETVQDKEILLFPGVVISTGTPGAVEIRDGDVVSCYIDGFESLSNPVVRR